MRARGFGVVAVAVVACLTAPAASAQEPVAPTPSPTPSASPTPTPTPAPSPSTPTPGPSPSPEFPVPPDPAVPVPDPYDPDAPPPAETPGGSVDPAAAEARRQAELVRVTKIALAELDRARTRLAEVGVRRDAANAEVDAAKAAEQQLAALYGDAQAAEGEARRDLGNLARLAYTSGPTEWTLIETFLDADNPSDALRRASVSAMVAERQDTAWDRTVTAVADADQQVKQASARVAAAQTAAAAVQAEYQTAEDQVNGIVDALRGGALTGGAGVEAVQKICGDTPILQCVPSGWGEDSLTRDAVWLMRTVRQKWPQIAVVGGYRPVDPYPDHPSGRAVDVMVPDGGHSAAGAATGDEIATYFMEHADEFGVMYLIWRQRIWMVDRDPVAPPSQWRQMSDRGDWTSNHMDHVHITVSTGVSGSDIYSVVAAAKRSKAR